MNKPDVIIQVYQTNRNHDSLNIRFSPDVAELIDCEYVKVKQNGSELKFIPSTKSEGYKYNNRVLQIQKDYVVDKLKKFAGRGYELQSDESGVYSIDTSKFIDVDRSYHKSFKCTATKLGGAGAVVKNTDDFFDNAPMAYVKKRPIINREVEEKKMDNTVITLVEVLESMITDKSQLALIQVIKTMLKGEGNE